MKGQNEKAARAFIPREERLMFIWSSDCKSAGDGHQNYLPRLAYSFQMKYNSVHGEKQGEGTLSKAGGHSPIHRTCVFTYTTHTHPTLPHRYIYSMCRYRSVCTQKLPSATQQSNQVQSKTQLQSTRTLDIGRCIKFMRGRRGKTVEEPWVPPAIE